MSGRTSISAYTPSNTDPETLKRIFVQREKLLEQIVARLSRSMTSGDMHHSLLVGPRGSGKTHFVSLVAADLAQQHDLEDLMRIAWLGEDDSFTGLIHLAFGIAKQLAQEYPNEFPADFKSSVRGLPADDAALAVLQKIIDQLGNRSLILLTENLDHTFRGLGDSGRKIWRAFLQETRKISTLATSQQLFESVSDRKETFFGFFDIHHLKPLSVDEAQELISRISHEHNKSDLVEFLQTPEGRYRVRALHYLAGGNHRMYVLLAEFLTKESLEDLVTAFEDLANDMTPYFQERMRSLSDQQRQLAQCLCDTEGALTVKQIAEETFIEERSCSKQLGTLKAKGYVRSEKRGKESYYDMAEPLMRLCLEVKNQRGRPLQLVARFLRAWFPATALQRLSTPETSASRVSEYCLLARQSSNSFERSIASELDNAIAVKMSVKDYDAVAALADELQFVDGPSALETEARLGFIREDFGYAIKKLTSILEIPEASVEQKVRALNNRGLTHGQQGDVALQLADYTAVIDMPEASVEQKTKALINRGVAHGQQGDVALGIEDFTAVIDIPEAPVEQKTQALINRGATHGQQGDVALGLADYTAVIDLHEAPVEYRTQALINRGLTHGQQGDVALELADYTAVIDMPEAPVEQKAQALYIRGITHGQQGDVALQLADYTAVIDMPEASVEQKTQALINRGITHGQQGDVALGLADFTAVIDMPEAPVELKVRALYNRGLTHKQQGDVALELADYTAVIDMPDAPVELKVRALNNQGVANWQNENFEESTRYFEAAIALTPGLEKPDTHSLFAVVEPMIEHRSHEEIVQALTRAFAEGDATSSDYGGTPQDLLWMVLRRSPTEWPSYISSIADLYTRHDSAAKLGQGLTQSIQYLDEGGFSSTQIKAWYQAWYQAWQSAASHCEDLHIPLKCLRASVAVISATTPTDQPLYSLPPEIRNLVRPLLTRSLGETGDSE